MIKAIIFDYDGVIVDSFAGVFLVYQKICDYFGVACPEDIEEFRKTYGYNYLECLTNLGVAEKDFDKAQAIYQEEIVKINHSIFANIAEVIIELSSKYKLYLVSASHSHEVLPKIERFGLSEYFEQIYCGTDEKKRKNEMMTEVIASNNYLPTEVISIGDRAIDYAASKQAGIEDENIILVTYGWGLDVKLVAEANIVNSPLEILNLLKSYE
ncbi:MAG: HAD family hydrolase [Patescibacteria group bacterium]